MVRLTYITYIYLKSNTCVLNILIIKRSLFSRKLTGNARNDICERLDDFEGRLLHLELILTDASDSYNMS